METRQQGSTLFSAVLVLIAILVVIQLWLVAAAVEALMARQTAVLVPTAIASSALLALSSGLLWYVVSFDARVRHGSPRWEASRRSEAARRPGAGDHARPGGAIPARAPSAALSGAPRLGAVHVPER